MPWVTLQVVATNIAWAAGRADALPTVSGIVRVRKSKAAGLAPGSLFALNFSQNGVAGLVARVESITVPSPAKPEVRISFREDRAFLNHPHYLPPDDSDPVDEPFGTAPLSHEAVIELPYALSPALNRHWLAALAPRGDTLTNGMKVWVGADKLQPHTLQHERDLASIASLPFTLQYRARRPLYPLNLRVNEDGRTPTYGAGADVRLNRSSHNVPLRPFRPLYHCVNRCFTPCMNALTFHIRAPRGLGVAAWLAAARCFLRILV